jgi:hypothetical protein
MGFVISGGDESPPPLVAHFNPIVTRKVPKSLDRKR